MRCGEVLGEVWKSVLEFGEGKGRCGEKCRGCGEVCCGSRCREVLREVWGSVLGCEAGGISVGGGVGKCWGRCGESKGRCEEVCGM